MNVYVESNFVLELALIQEQSASCCFLNRNSKDFDDQNIVDELAGYNCQLLFQFDAGYSFINAALG